MRLFDTWAPSRAVQLALWAAGVVLAAGIVLITGVDHPGVWAFAVFFAAAPMLTAIDFAEHRLPDLITLPSAALSLVGVVIGAAVTGQWSALLGAVLAMVGTGVVFFVMFLLAGGSFGFGDVKLGLSMGLSLGTISFLAPFIGPFAGMFLASLVGVVLMILRKADRKTHIALGPYLIAGTVLTILLSQLVP